MKLEINKKNIKPVVLMTLIYLVCYYIPKFAVPENRWHYVFFKIDEMIPLFSPMIIVYMGAFVQWIIACYLLLNMEEDKVRVYTSAIIYGSIISFIVFMVYPTAIYRPSVEVHNIFDWLVRYVYLTDSPVNCVPSLHCLISTGVLFIYKDSKLINNKLFICSFIFSVLVYLSTLLTRQHYVIDVFVGIIVALLSVAIARKYQVFKK